MPTFPIVLQSPDGQFFRRISANGSFERKILGLDWEKHDPDFISSKDLPKYLETMTKRLKWKISK